MKSNSDQSNRMSMKQADIDALTQSLLSKASRRNGQGCLLDKCPCGDLHDPSSISGECRVELRYRCGSVFPFISCTATGCAEARALLNEQLLDAAAGAGGRVTHARHMPAIASNHPITSR